METQDRDRLPPPPAPSAEAETARFTAQAVEAGTTEKENVKDAAAAKKKSDAGMANYFVSWHDYDIELR